MKRALIAAGVVAVLAVIVIGSVRANGRRSGGTEVRAEPVERRAITQVIKASGQVDPRVKVNISSPLIAKIERLFVEEGDAVQLGEPFLELEKAAFVAVRDRAAAQVEITRSAQRRATINLSDAELRLRRAQRLTSENVVAQEMLDSAQLAYDSAQLELEQAGESILQAEAELEKARDDLSKTTLFAPLTGRVIALNAEEGEVVVSGTMNNPASVIGTVADLSELLVEVDVDENEIVDAAVDQRATLIVDAIPDTQYRGRVVEIGSSGFSPPQQPDVTYFKVKVLLDDPDPRLRPGMSARAEIEVETRPSTLVVPIQAVLYRSPNEDEEENNDTSGKDDEIRVVFVAENGQARQTPVEIGISDETHIEITSGLEQGELVVVGPYRALRDLTDEQRLQVETDDGPAEGPSEDEPTEES